MHDQPPQSPSQQEERIPEHTITPENPPKTPNEVIEEEGLGVTKEDVKPEPVEEEKGIPKTPDEVIDEEKLGVK